MRFNIFHKKRSNLLSQSLIIILSLVILIVSYIFSGLSMGGAEGQEIGYIRDVYRDQQYWVMTLDKVPSQVGANKEKEETPLDNLEKVVLADRFEVDISSLDPTIRRTFSPLSLYNLIITTGADFQNIPFVVTFEKGRVVRLEEIL